MKVIINNFKVQKIKLLMTQPEQTQQEQPHPQLPSQLSRTELQYDFPEARPASTSASTALADVTDYERVLDAVKMLSDDNPSATLYLNNPAPAEMICALSRKGYYVSSSYSYSYRNGKATENSCLTVTLPSTNGSMRCPYRTGTLGLSWF